MSTHILNAEEALIANEMISHVLESLSQISFQIFGTEGTPLLQLIEQTPILLEGHPNKFEAINEMIALVKSAAERSNEKSEMKTLIQQLKTLFRSNNPEYLSAKSDQFLSVHSIAI